MREDVLIDGLKYIALAVTMETADCSDDYTVFSDDVIGLWKRQLDKAYRRYGDLDGLAGECGDEPYGQYELEQWIDEQCNIGGINNYAQAYFLSLALG